MSELDYCTFTLSIGLSVVAPGLPPKIGQPIAPPEPEPEPEPQLQLPRPSPKPRRRQSTDKLETRTAVADLVILGLHVEEEPRRRSPGAYR